MGIKWEHSIEMEMSLHQQKEATISTFFLSPHISGLRVSTDPSYFSISFSIFTIYMMHNVKYMVKQMNL